MTNKHPALQLPLIQDWLAALRSGQYKQGRHLLNTMTATGAIEYCCLGVLCDVANKKHGIPLTKKNGRIAGGSLVDQKAVWKASHLADAGNLKPLSEYTSLTDLNDTEKATFNQIADYIEANADVLFIKPSKTTDNN